MTTLSDVLQTTAKTQYKNLFSNDFVVYNRQGKTWSISTTKPDNLPDYYAALLQDLIETRAYRGIPKSDLFVQQFNAKRILAGPIDLPSPTPTRTIHFHPTKTPQFAFLSNLYETAILFMDHNNPSQQFLYPSAANAYQAHRIALLSSLTAEEPAPVAIPVGDTAAKNDKPAADRRPKVKEKTRPSPTPAAEASTSAEAEESVGLPTINELPYMEPEQRIALMDQIAVAPPVQAKELASAVYYTTFHSDVDAVRKSKLIQAIVLKKFQDNPVLKTKLLNTGQVDLVEDLGHPFWGAKHPEDPALQKSYAQPITAASRNVSGRTLMAVRTALLHK
ncbi:MAG: NADAR family protein [Simkania sp.]|nr:NADAR family protein [Simkania sp.]